MRNRQQKTWLAKWVGIREVDSGDKVMSKQSEIFKTSKLMDERAGFAMWSAVSKAADSRVSRRTCLEGRGTIFVVTSEAIA